MRLSVVSPNRERMPDPLLPIGAATVAGLARGLGHEVRFLDLCHEPDTAAAVHRHFDGWQPDLVAISLRNLENNQLFGHHSYVAEARSVVDTLRAASGAPILAGGAAFSLFPSEAMEALGVDFGFAGEVEGALDQLLARLSEGAAPEGVPGALWRVAGTPVREPGEPRPWSLEETPLPAYDLLDRERYVSEGAVIPVETKRGCDLLCSFCPEGLRSSRARLKDPALVADEIEQLVPLVGTRRLFFTDGVFQEPPAHAAAVCEEILRKDLDVRWSCGVNPIGLTRDLLRLMRRAGCRAIALGLDAITAGMLDEYRKGFGPEQIEAALADVRSVGLRHTIHILVGGPGETDHSLEDSLAALARIAADDTVFIALGIRVYRKTALEEELVAGGVLPSDGARFRPTYYLSPLLGGDVVERLQRACETHPGWYTVPF